VRESTDAPSLALPSASQGRAAAATSSTSQPARDAGADVNVMSFMCQ
jgi:hypothetical protein